MPSTSTASPLLTQFYGCAIIILVLAMCCSCLVYAMYFMNSSGLQTHESTVAQKLKVVFSQDGRGVLSNTLSTRDGLSSSDGNGVVEITLRKNLWLCFFFFFGAGFFSSMAAADALWLFMQTSINRKISKKPIQSPTNDGNRCWFKWLLWFCQKKTRKKERKRKHRVLVLILL